MSFVSIITPAYRAEHFIARAVKSALAQTHMDWEMIIASDDGQDYEQILKIQGIHDARLRFATTNGIATGVSHARNAALKAAKADIVALLDADDFFFPQKLEKTLPFAQEYGLCTCGIQYITFDTHDRETALKHHNPSYREGILRAEVYPLVNYSTNAILVFDRTRMKHRWNETLPVMEDLVFAMQSYDFIDAAYHVAEPLHGYIKRDGSLCNQSDSAEKFIHAKERIMQLIENGGIGIRNEVARMVLQTFIGFSLEAEKAFVEAQKANPSLAFPAFLMDRMSKAGMINGLG